MSAPLNSAMLERVQALLEAIYGVRCEHQARDFLVVDGEVAQALGASGQAPEELLVHQPSDEELDVALYISPSVLSRLQPFVGEPDGALDFELKSFCELAEGVSHFMYLLRSAALERKVSLLELEAQAEVDKFALCTVLRWGSEVKAWAAAVSERLFARVRLREHLGPAEVWRYGEANRLAQRYCGRLLKQLRPGRLDVFLGELRHMYRLGAEAKLAYLGR